MKLRAALAGLVLLAACHPTRSCAQGTLFVTLTANGAAMATQLVVTLVAGGATLHSSFAYAGQPTATLALDFPHGYPSGAAFTLNIAAVDGTTALARGTTSGTLPGGCDGIGLTLSSLAGDGGSATPVLVGTSSIPPLSTATLSPALPAGTQAGDYLVLCVYANTSALTATLPANWTPLDELISSQGFHTWWLTRFADGNDPAPTTTLSAKAPTASAVLIAVRGVDPQNPIDAKTTAGMLNGSVNNQQITFVAPALTTTRGNERLVSFFVFNSGDGGSWVVPPTGLVNEVDTGSLAVFDASVGVGPSGPFSATAMFTAGDDHAGTAVTLALAPP